MNSTETTSRLKNLLRSRKIKQTDLADMTGFSQSNISEMLNGKRNVVPLAEKVAELFDLDKKLLLGEEYTLGLGESAPKEETRPRIEAVASAGTLTEAIEEYSEPVRVVAQMPRYDFTIVVRGDSMVPEFRSGDEIACLKVNEKAFVQWGKPHVLFTSQGIVVKRLYEGDNGFRCVSDNEQYPEFFVPGDEVYSVNLVVGVIRTF